MFWRNKNKVKQPTIQCEHDWFELDTYKELVDVSVGMHIDFETKEFMYIYCPKCDITKRTDPPEGNRILKANEIKKNYRTQ